MKTDILIVGTGCSGLYCALNLPRDKKIVMITKSDLESSDSFLAQGGICMWKSVDDYNSFFEDTMKAGHYENDKKSVEIMIKSSPDVIEELISYGVDFWHLPERGHTLISVFYSMRISQVRRLLGICLSRYKSLRMLLFMIILLW